MKQPPKPGRDSLSKYDIVKEMQKHIKDIGLTNKVVLKVLEAFMEVYKESIIDNPRVEIRGFGILSKELVKGRIIKHPETGEEAIASPYYKLSFAASKKFRERLRNKAKADIQKVQ